MTLDTLKIEFQAETGGLLFVVPQMMMVILGAVWAMAATFMYPMLVTYKVTFGQLIKNIGIIHVLSNR